MDPNQQPQNQNQGGYPPQPPQAPPAQPGYVNTPQQPTTYPVQQPPFSPQQPQASYGPQAQSTHQQGYGPQPQAPQAPSQPGYGPQPTPTYAVDYLEQIAPPPANAKFLSGSFGKIIVGLGVVMVLAVSIIVAFGNSNKTADLQSLAIKLDNAQKITSTVKLTLKDEKLTTNNSNYTTWLINTDRDAYSLLSQAKVAKKDFDKKTVATQTAATTALIAKLTDARLNANLDSVYASEMAYQTQLLKNTLDTMAKRSQSKSIRDFAKKASDNLTPYQKSFANFKEDSL